jgi:hypothetical protein
MSILGGPVGTILVGIAALIALVLWLTRRRRYPGPRIEGDEGVDHEELEAAEREVRDLDPNQRPEDGFLGDDWGPGASRPRPPERL